MTRTYHSTTQLTRPQHAVVPFHHESRDGKLVSQVSQNNESVPTCRIDHIRQATAADGILYVGHSQGTTMALAAMAKSVPATKHITGAVLLAPVAFVSGTRSQTLSALAALDVPAIIRRFGVRSFLPCTAGSSLVFSQICTYLPSFCEAFLQELAGHSRSLNSTRIPLYLNFLPAGVLLVYMRLLAWHSMLQTQVCRHRMLVAESNIQFQY